MRTYPQPEPTYAWPDMKKDAKAVELAIAELGRDASHRELLNRAQAIKEELTRKELEAKKCC